jgi:hypothetical protein
MAALRKRAKANVDRKQMCFINQPTFLTQSFNVTHAVRVVKNVAIYTWQYI